MTDDPTTDDVFANAIGGHIIQHVGPITNVFHERVPSVVQIDVLVVGPSDERPFTTLVTCGMSDRAMHVPIEDPDDLARIPELRYAELLLCLPPDWPLTPEAFADESNYWPIRWLKPGATSAPDERLARPGSYDSQWRTAATAGPEHAVPRLAGGRTGSLCSRGSEGKDSGQGDQLL